MIDFSKFDFKPGDPILFAGNDRTGLLTLPGQLLDVAIKGISRSITSHCGFICDPRLPGLDGYSVYIAESTIRDDAQSEPILGKRNGVQVNLLQVRLEDYRQGDGQAWWLPYSDRALSWLDINAMWPVLVKKIGEDDFSIIDMTKFLLRHIPLVQEIPELDEASIGEEYCAELLSKELSAAGVPGLRAALQTAQTLAELRLYRECVQIMGEPATIARFNSV